MLINPFMVAPARPDIPASTKILMPFTTTSGFTDVANNHAITVVGSPTISTAQSKFGAGALLVNTTTNYLRIAATPTLNFSGNKVFTIELWVYTTAYTGDSILSTRNASVYSPFLIGQQRSLIGNASLNTWTFLTAAIPTNQWVHVALVMDGTNIKEYVNGVKTGATVAHPSWPSSNSFLNIGYDVSGSFAGYINDLRISDVAVYTANFTPPTSPF